MTDPLHQQRFQTAPRIVLRHPSQPAIHHRLDPIQGQRGLCHIRSHHHFRPIILLQSRILILRRHLSMQRQNHRFGSTQPGLQIPSRAADFVSARQKNQHVPFPRSNQTLRLSRRYLRRPRSTQILPMLQIFDLHRKCSSFRTQHLCSNPFRQLLCFQSCRHHDENQIRPTGFLQIQNPPQR